MVKYIIETLKQNCLPFIENLKECKKGSLLIRAICDIEGDKRNKYNVKTNFSINEFDHTPELRSRIPRGMPVEIHLALNDKFIKQFGWKVRNGIFCYGVDGTFYIEDVNKWGTNYLVFPIGEFKFVYSPDDYDLTESAKKDDFSVENVKYIDDNLCKAINLRDKSKVKSNEIIIKADSYFLINLKYANDIIEMIWGK